MSKPNISFFFPVYNDDNTIEPLTKRTVEVLRDIANEFEIVIVNDGSRDRSGEVADEMAARYPQVTAVHHTCNLGYGKALQTGFAHANRYEWICFTDGDFQYDPAELYAIVDRISRYDMIIGFRRQRVYGPLRIAMSATLNLLVHWAFGTSFRDIACGFKIVHRSVLHNIRLTSNSGFIGAELVVRAVFQGFHVGEVAINTYVREFGDSAVVSVRNITNTVKDLWKVRRELFRNQPRSQLRPSQSLIDDAERWHSMAPAAPVRQGKKDLSPTIVSVPPTASSF
jgi:glycosyltransferase involved in cell wall biosynthesis